MFLNKEQQNIYIQIKKKRKHSSLIQTIYNNISLWVLCFFLILAFVNLRGHGPIFYFLFCFVAVMLFLFRSIKPTAKLEYLWPYILLTIGSCIASVLYYDVSMFVKAICPILSFVFGYRLRFLYKNCTLAIKCITYSILIGLFLIFAITYYFNYFVLNVQPGDRHITDIWVMDIGALPITIFSLYSSFIIGISFYMILIAKNKIEILVGILLLAFVLYVNEEAASRSPFLILILVYAFLMLPYVKFTRKNQSYKKRFIYLMLFLALGILFVAYQSIRNTNREESPLEARMEKDGMESSRTELASQYFSLMFEYPYGGGFGEKKIHKLAHNFIQECHDTFGICAFISLIVISISLIRIMIKKFKSRCFKSQDFLLLGLSLSVLIQSLLEPILAAYPQLMWCLFMYHGILISCMETDNQHKRYLRLRHSSVEKSHRLIDNKMNCSYNINLNKSNNTCQ